MAGTTAEVSEPEAGVGTGLFQAASPAIVLASASTARRALLRAAGLRFDAVATGVDERAVKLAALQAGRSARDAALLLARCKAACVSRPDALVIGCDQILVCDGIWFDKPPTLRAARDQLLALRGRVHTLETATVILRDGEEVWQHAAAPMLTMRRFGDAFLDAYLAAEGDAVLGSVGAYRLEGLGQHLFDEVRGEHAAILGLPMLPLLGFLRGCNLIGA